MGARRPERDATNVVPMTRPTATCLALLTVVGATACGSHAATKAGFVARADAICSTTVRSIRATGQASASTLAGQLASEEHQLRSLPRPEQSAENRATLQRYLTALDRDVVNYRALATATARGDSAARADAESALRTSPTTPLAARYGLKDCTHPGSTST